MKTVRPVAMAHLFLLLFTLSVILLVSSYSSAFSGVVSWSEWGSSFKPVKTMETISHLSFIEDSSPVQYVYDSETETADVESKPVFELKKNQYHIRLDTKTGDIFRFCFRTPPGLSTENFPFPPLITMPGTGEGVADILAGGMRLIALDGGLWQHQYSASWRLPAGKESLILSIEDNDNEWFIAPDCGGVFSGNTDLSSSGDNKRSTVDIIFRNTLAPKDGLDNPDDTSRFSALFEIPGSDAFDNSEPLVSSGGGSFDGGSFGGDDDSFKKRPGGNGMNTPYFFGLMSRMTWVYTRVTDVNGQAVKKRILVPRIVLKIQQGWNDREILISQQLWNRIKRANRGRDSGLFLALSRNPDNPEAAFENYLKLNPVDTDYRPYAQEELILSLKQLRSVSVFPGNCPTGLDCSGKTGDVNQKMNNLNLDPRPPSYSSLFDGSNKNPRAGGGGGGGDGSENPNNRMCITCGLRPESTRGKCYECIEKEATNFEQDPLSTPSSSATRPVDVAVSSAKSIDANALIAYMWLENLPPQYDRRTVRQFFYRAGGYVKSSLYLLLASDFLGDESKMKAFNEDWFEFTRSRMTLDQLIIKVSKLEEKEQDKHAYVAKVIKTLAFHWDTYLEKKYPEDKESFVGELKRKFILSDHEKDDFQPPELLVESKNKSVKFIYDTIKNAILLLADTRVPSEFYTMQFWSVISRDLFRNYHFGVPVQDDGRLNIEMWGCLGFSFIVPDNKEKLRNVGSEMTFDGLIHQVIENTNLNYDQVSAMLIASNIFEPFADDDIKMGHLSKMGMEQLKLGSRFAEQAVEKIAGMLLMKGEDEKNKFIGNIFLVFGDIPKRFDSFLKKPEERLPTPVMEEVQAAANHHHHVAYTLDSKVPSKVFEDYILELSNNWRILAGRLGIDWSESGAIKDNYAKVQYMTQEMLNTWSSKNGNNANFRSFLEALQKMGRNDIKQKIERQYNLPRT